MQHNLPVLFFLTLAVYIRTNRNPHSPLLDETGSNRTGLFSRLLETCCWKIVPSPCGCISTEPKLRLFIMGEEGLTTLSRIDPTDPLFRRSFFYFRDRPGISTASSFYRRAPSPPSHRSSFAELRFPRVDPLGIGKLVVTDISSPGFLTLPALVRSSLRRGGSFSRRAIFFIIIIITSFVKLVARLDSSIDS